MSKIKVTLPSGLVVEGRRPKVKDMKLVKDIPNDIDRELALMINVCEMIPPELDELDWKDYEALREKLL